jgi:hypothetical protein
MLKQCIAKIALAMQRVAWCLLVAFPCLACVVHVAHDANARLNILDSRRQWFPCSFATIIKQDLVFLWQKFFTQATPLSKRALGEWPNISFLH